MIGPLSTQANHLITHLRREEIVNCYWYLKLLGPRVTTAFTSAVNILPFSDTNVGKAAGVQRDQSL
jgi:hypothetical protein